VLAEDLPATVLAAQCENEGRACHDPEMNAEAEGGKISSQIKTDEYTARACLPKILHDQFLRIAHLSVTS